MGLPVTMLLARMMFAWAAALLVATSLGATAAAARAKLEAKNAALPLLFEPNVGQAADDVAFIARGQRYLLSLTADGMIASYTGDGARTAAVRVRFSDARPGKLDGVDEQASKTNYLIGDPQRWRTDVRTFKRVRFPQVYEGIDLVFYGNERRVEYDFIVAAGADPTQIALAFDHPSNPHDAVPLRIDSNGDLVLGRPENALSFKSPVAYQDIDGGRRPVDSRYVLRESRVAFEIGAYDTTRPLVIDPVLVYSGYLGGTQSDEAQALAIDSAGNVYFTGVANSTDYDLANALQPQHGYASPHFNGFTAFVTKLNAAGDALVYSTYLGGSNRDGCSGIGDIAHAIGVDAAGNAVIAGRTCSNNFPGASNTRKGANEDAFVAKLNAAGNAIVYAHYLGDDEVDIAESVAVDSAGNAYIGGSTDGPGTFPTTAGTWRPTRADDNRTLGFITKLDPNGATVWSSYVPNIVRDLAIDQQNPPNIFLSGETDRTDFPATEGAYSRQPQGSTDATVIKLNPSGSAPIYATYFGGSGSDGAGYIAIGPQGNAYLHGLTLSTDLPLTITSFDATNDDLSTYFAVLNENGSALLYSTYLGAEKNDTPESIAVRFDGVAYLTGGTGSYGFPVKDAIQNADGVGCVNGGVCPGGAAYVTWIKPEGRGQQDLQFSTYLGGNGTDRPVDIAVDAAGSAYIVGLTTSTDFPEAGFPVQDKNDGSFDTFITKIGGAVLGPTDTPTRSHTPTRTPTASSTVSRTPTPSVTRTGTPSPTPSASQTEAPTSTRVATFTLMPTATSTATPTIDLCGNNRIDGDEECDEGELNSDTAPNRCRTTCVSPRCGDNVRDDDPPFSESCDDGNQADGDGCPSTCALQIVLNPFLILGKGLCDNAPVPIAVTDLGTGADISADPDIEYEWIRGPIAPRILDAALKRFTKAIEEKADSENPLVIKTATLAVVKGAGTAEVQFKPGQEGLGVNVLRAVRKRNGVVVAESNIALVIAGMKLAEETGLEIEPVSPLSSAAGFITDAIGKEVEEPPLILFKHGPLCNGEADFLGAEGFVRVKSIKFELFGGLIEDVDLIAAMQAVIGALPTTTGPLGFIAKAVEKGLPYIVSQFLDFEVSSKAAEDAEEESGETQTEDNVIRITDELTVTPPFFRGVVIAKEPGISAVQATLNLERFCLGKADDSVLVLVGPRLDKVEIRNEPGLFESPLTVPLGGDRTPHAVATFTMVPSGSPQVLEFDPVNLTGDRVTNFRKKVERFIPGLEQILDGINIPIEIVVPRGAMREGDRDTYRGGNAYFQIAFQYNPFPGTITISELRLQTRLPNLPLLTSWRSIVLREPVVLVAPSAATTTGLKRGTGQIRVDVCLPFLTGPGSDPADFEEVRVSGDDITITGTKYEDLNANGALDSGERGLRDWTIHAVDLYNRVVATTTSGAAGQFIMIVPKERFPPESASFGVREELQTGWSATNPQYGFRTGLPLATSAHFVTLGNFRDIELSGRKFHDRDGDGLPASESQEEGLFGWRIELIDAVGNVQRTTSDPDGRYEFSIPYDAFVGPGQVMVREVTQSGWTATFPRDGAAQPIGAIGRVLRSGQKVTVNFGNFRDLRIQGRKFNDRNGNGMRDDGEVGLEDWTIQFVDTFGRVRTAVTDVDGDYFFRLPLGIFRGPGQAQVREVQQPGWMQTFPFGGGPRDFPDANDGGLISDGRYEANFGNRSIATATPTPTSDDPTSTPTPTEDDITATPTETQTATRTPANILTGVKYEDVNGNGQRDVNEPRLRDWVIFLDDNLDDVLNNAASGNGVCDANAEEECKRTDAAGVYAFVVGEGFYRVREVQQPGWMQTSQNPPDVVVEGDDGVIPRIAVVDANGPSRRPLREPQGPPQGERDDGNPFVLRSSARSVSKHDPFSERRGDSLGAGPQSFQFLDFGNFRLGTVPGIKFEDVDGNARRDTTDRGLAGWTIFADDNDNRVLDAGEASVTTGEDGTYRFQGLPPGRHILREVNRCGYAQTLPANQGGYEVDLASGEGVEEKNFGNRPPMAIPGDSNRDGAVSAADFVAGVDGLTGARQNELMDANQDGRIDDDDLNATAANLFACNGLFALVPPLATHTPRVSNTPTLVPTSTPPPSTATRTLGPPTSTPTAVVTDTATKGPATGTPTGTPTHAAPTPTATGTATGTSTRGTPTPTVASGGCSEPAIPIPIPDASVAGVDDILTLGDTTQIDDLNVRLQIDHTWVGDLTITLTHVATGTTVTLIDRPGVPATEVGCNATDIDAVLTDEASEAAEDTCDESIPGLSGRLRPAALLDAFGGETLNGQWRLHLVDGAAADIGALVRWCLESNTDEGVPHGRF